MRTLLLLFLIFMFCASASGQQLLSVLRDTIQWKGDYKLQWKDFQGKPDTSVIALAVCASEINYQYKIVDGKLIFSIDCYFDKQRSWIKHNMKVILDHEQGHFDISKLFALKLTERFSMYKLNVASVDRDLTHIYNQIIRERTIMQDRYDTETKSTTSDKVQIAFIKNVRKEIELINQRLKKNKRTTFGFVNNCSIP